MLPYLFLLVGFVALIKGADLLVTGGSAIAKHFKISNLVIGLTIVAFGTSAPEFVVTFFAALTGSSDLAISNIVGSVVTNVLLGLGIAAIIFPLAVNKGTVWKEIPFSLLAIVALIFLVNDSWVKFGGIDQLSWVDGVILILFFAIFLYYTYGLTKGEKANDDDIVKVKEISTGKATVYVLLGVVALFIGGKWIVDNAIIIAQSLGVSETLIGLIVTGPGTSLPELAATAMAAKRRNVEMAVGGIVGSNIFNIFWILGVSAVVGPLMYDSVMNVDLSLILFASFLLFITLFVGKKHYIERWQGIGFVMLYVVYMVYLFMRG